MSAVQSETHSLFNYAQTTVYHVHFLGMLSNISNLWEEGELGGREGSNDPNNLLKLIEHSQVQRKSIYSFTDSNKFSSYELFKKTSQFLEKRKDYSFCFFFLKMALKLFPIIILFLLQRQGIMPWTHQKGSQRILVISKYGIKVTDTKRQVIDA